MKVRIAHAPVDTGRHPKRFSESASERLQRSVVGVQGNLRDGHPGMPQLVARSFQQQPPPHRCRSLLGHASEQPVELRAALIGLARQILRLRRSVHRVRNDCGEAIYRVC